MDATFDSLGGPRTSVSGIDRPRLQAQVERVRIGVVLPRDRLNEVSLRIPPSPYSINGCPIENTDLRIGIDGDALLAVFDQPNARRLRAPCLTLVPRQVSDTGGVTLRECVVGRGFHWERSIDAVLPGRLEISVARTPCGEQSALLVVNELPVETYLPGVITAEMSGRCPLALLKAQCIVARSWLVAASERKHADLGIDLCNDDCCQRFQGVAQVTASARIAANETSGQVLVVRPPRAASPLDEKTPHEPVVVDANYSKCCGGIVEAPEQVWGFLKPGQYSVVDAPVGTGWHRFDPLGDEKLADYLHPHRARDGAAYCSPASVPDEHLSQYLGRVDDGSGHFRWGLVFPVEQVEKTLRVKHFDRVGMAPAESLARLWDLRVVRRGRSGRATRLAVEYETPSGSRRTTAIDDQYWIRHALSETFLYSSAFDLRIDRDTLGRPRQVTLAGAGWGHGAGLCQIGALGMALSSSTHEQILRHYFENVSLERVRPG